MPFTSSCLLEKSVLTSTDNKFLKEISNLGITSKTLAEDVSSFKSCVLSSHREKKSHLTTSNWLIGNCATLQEKVPAVDVENKFLKSGKSYDSYKRKYSIILSNSQDVSIKLNAECKRKKLKKAPKHELCFDLLPCNIGAILDEQVASFAAAPVPDISTEGEREGYGQCFRSMARKSAPAAPVPHISTEGEREGYGQCFGSVARKNASGFPQLCFKQMESSIPETEFSASNGMPIYNFEKLVIARPYQAKFHLLEEDHELKFHKKLKEVMDIKMHLLNAVSISLMYSPDFMNSEDPFRLQLLKCSDHVTAFDPEFILKVALYARQELNIRSTSNFLLAYSAYNHSCRPFLVKYFASSIKLPSDWIGVAELYTTFSDCHLKPRSLPSALRKVMKSTFTKFDEYQLAKYNKVQKKRKIRKSEFLNDDSQCKHDKLSERKKPFCIKKLIQLLHITTPVESVMCLLGKKYPEDPESFRQSRLPGIWNSEKAGKRMKLPQPETWETMISSGGNKAKVWEYLIDNSKLPYMATLRNLKNIIMSGVSQVHHNKVLNHLTNKKAVVKSKQFPLRFYAAYKYIENIELLVNTKITDRSKSSKLEPEWRKKQRQIMIERAENADPTVTRKYKAAVSQALEISVLHNMDPVEGKTLIICDLLQSFQETGKTDASSAKAYDNCIMLGLMCLKACEDCEMKVIPWNYEVENIKLSKQSFLENMSKICEKFTCPSDILYDESLFIKALKNLMEFNLNPFSTLTRKIDNLILVLSSPSVNSSSVKNAMSGYVHKYRHLINPDLLYVQVNITSGGQSFGGFENSTHKNDIFLSGFNDQVLKYIGERGNGRQLAYIETIDKKYTLEERTVAMHLKKSSDINPVAVHQEISKPRLPKWQTVRIFISSTFKDMHGERDLLLRYVLPELRARVSSFFVKISEVDLRWGITEEYSSSRRCAQLCLYEAQNCDLFIGLLGERYGTIYNFEPPEDPQFDWLKDYPPESSITELEIHAGALRNPNDLKSRAFFYFRNKKFLRNVPEEWLNWFQSENSESNKKLSALKSQIKSSGMNVFDEYYCHWGGLGNGLPVVAGLDQFGKRVLEDLTQAVTNLHCKERNLDEIAEEYQYQMGQYEEHNYFTGEKDTPLHSLVDKIKMNEGTFVVTGKPGSGKSAFIVKLLKSMESFSIIHFFVGATSRSTELAFMLEYIAKAISEKLKVPNMYPKTKQDMMNHFTDILFEGAKYSVLEDLIIVIDGMDHLDINAQTLDWLPYTMPAGIKLICSASESSLAYETLSRREKHGCRIHFATLNSISISDRQNIVKQYLQEHRKVLDESSFNNQMLQLVTKAHSGNPLYLHLACDYLRIFATYDNLMSTIQKLPSTLHLISDSVILQMEQSHGSSIVQGALTLISIAKEGLAENELHDLLSLSVNKLARYNQVSFTELLTAVLSIQPEDKLEFVNFRSLLHILRIFVCKHKRSGTLKLASSQFSAVLKKYYWNHGYEHQVKLFHQLLAAYYTTICDPTNNRSWTGLSASAFRSVMFHLFHGQCYKELSTTLCSLHFIQAAFEMYTSDDLLEYFILLLDQAEQKQKSAYRREKMTAIDTIHSYYSFVSQNVHIFKQYPQMVKQQALNEPVESVVFKSVLYKRSMLECLTRSSIIYCRYLTVNFLKNIISLSAHKTKPIAAIGCEDGSLKMLNQDTGKVISTIKGHSSAITFVCFIGTDRVCTASTDNTISIWSITDYIKIANLKGHTRHISSCCSDPAGNVIVSSAWDHTVRLWSSRDGSQISCISDIRCPVNCVAHHPEQQLIACGLWNRCIEVWNTLSLERKAVLRGHTSSVRSVIYSPDGLQILSSSLGMEVFVWSSVQGLRIGHLNGHTLPVNSIGCCSKGNFIVTGSDDCTLKVFPNQQQTSVFTINESKYCPISIMEIVEPCTLAVAFQNSEIWIFDLIDGHIVSTFDLSPEQLSCFSKHSGKEVTDHMLPASHVHEIVLFGTTLGKIMTLDLQNSSVSEVGVVNSSITSIVHSNCLILCGTSDGDIGLFSFDNKKPAMAYGVHEGSVTALSILMADMNGMALSASTDMTLKLWKLASTPELCVSILDTYEISQRDYITSCCLVKMPYKSCPSSVINFISGSYDNTVAVWIEKEQKIFEGLQTRVMSVKISKNFVVGCGQDGSIAVWTKQGKLISKIAGIEQSSAITTFDLQCGNCEADELNAILACVNSDGSIAIKKPFQRIPLCTLEGHSKAVTSCSVGNSGTILSSSPDMTLNIWKIPLDPPDFSVRHSAIVTGVAFSPSGNLALSSDVQGNIMLWAVNSGLETSPMRYIAHKKYTGGYITILSWLSGNKCVCATSFQSEHRVIIMKCCESPLDLEPTCVIEEEQHFKFTSEITCVDYVDTKDILVIGLKSGTIFLMTSNMQNQIKLSSDWILKVKVSQSDNPVLCIAEANGMIKYFLISSLLDSQAPKPVFMFLLENSPDSPIWISALGSDKHGNFYVGDTNGWLRYMSDKLLFSKQVHTDSITGICVSESHLFTSSLDRTVKVWKLFGHEQIGQFHCNVPITCLALPREIQLLLESQLLIIGSTTGVLQLLKWHIFDGSI